MADLNNSKPEKLRKDDNLIHEQSKPTATLNGNLSKHSANPSFHDTPEDTKNYRSLQMPPKIKKPSSSSFVLKPSLLTQKAEQIRTDKAAVTANQQNPLSLTNKFLVLGGDNNSKDFSASNQITNDKKGTHQSFVFGENIFSRVAKPDSSQSSETSKQFTDLVVNLTNDTNSDESDKTKDELLRQSAIEHQSQKQIVTHPQIEEAEVITGEELETSVLKTLCKLFQFNPDKNEWIENGFCNLHLNDWVDQSCGANSKDKTQVKSRLIVRSKGGLKVLVNTLIWADMGLARASLKAVRITAQCEDGIKSFLLTMQNADDAEFLLHVLETRKSRLASECTTTRKRHPTQESNSEDSTLSNPKKRVIERQISLNSEDEKSAPEDL